LVTTIENLAAGDYLVYLYHGSYVITKSVTIGSSTPVSININNFISPLVVGEPFTLSFEVEGAFNPQIWYGDESDITESPIHTYNEPGVYVITIIASNDYCSGIGQIEVSVIGQTTSIDNPTFNYDYEGVYILLVDGKTHKLIVNK